MSNGEYFEADQIDYFIESTISKIKYPVLLLYIIVHKYTYTPYIEKALFYLLVCSNSLAIFLNFKALFLKRTFIGPKEVAI